MPPSVRVEVRGRTGTPRGELVTARVVRLQDALEGGGVCEVEVSPDDPRAPTVADLGLRELYVYLDGTPWWGGPLWSVRGGDTGPLRYTARGLESYLDFRVIESTLTYTGVDQATILSNLLAHTQGQTDGDLGIVSEAAATGVSRDRTYAVDERQNVRDVMHRFRGYVNGVEWALRVRSDGSRALTTYYPQRGTTRTTAVLEWGRNVTAFDWAVDGQTVNDVITRGSGDGPSRVEGRYTDTTNRAARGLRTAVQDGGTIVEQASLVEASQAQVELRRDPLELVSGLTVRDTPQVPVLSLAVGDVHPVRIRRGAIATSRNVRIVTLDLDPYTETARLGVQPA